MNSTSSVRGSISARSALPLTVRDSATDTGVLLRLSAAEKAGVGIRGVAANLGYSAWKMTAMRPRDFSASGGSRLWFEVNRAPGPHSPQQAVVQHPLVI